MNLQALGDDIDAMTTDSEATLHCEMADFIRPDEDLQWFRGGQQITNGSRHTVTYEDGRPGVAQNGGEFLVPARVSVLTISDPVVADSGMYTCQIQGTTESANIQLSVAEGMWVLHSFAKMNSRCNSSLQVGLYWMPQVLASE